MNTTESPSNHDDLEYLEPMHLLRKINAEDHMIAPAVEKAIPQIVSFVEAAIEKMKLGGRLFYIGAGTSGRLGILDASEIPPTYGLPHGIVVGIIAGGDSAIRKAVEFAEDNIEGAWEDLSEYKISSKDVLVGIAASGKTPYVVGGVRKGREEGLITACITCNESSILADSVEFPIEVVVGPEFVTGSTRMKAGTAQKLVLNMISTSLMIQLGRVSGNKMVDMQLSNTKLVERGVRMIVEELGVSNTEAEKLLNKFGSVRDAIESQKK